MVRSLRRHELHRLGPVTPGCWSCSTCSTRVTRWLRLGPLTRPQPRDSAWGEVEPRPREDLGDPPLAEQRRHAAELLDEHLDEVRVLVDRHRHREQPRLLRLVEPSHPVLQRHRRHLEAPRRLFHRPPRPRTQRQDRHPRFGWVVRPLLCGSRLQPQPQDPSLLPAHLQRTLRLDQRALQLRALHRAVRGPTPHHEQGLARQPHRVEEAALGPVVPLRRDRDLPQPGACGGHGTSVEPEARLRYLLSPVSAAA